MAQTLPGLLDGVVKRYGSHTALDAVSFCIEPSRVTALLGPNGAGKTTAISLLLGLCRPTAGRVELFGTSPQSLAAKSRVGVMLQSEAMPDVLRVSELIRLISSYYPRPFAMEDIARLAGIGDLLRRSYRNLSGGQQRRVQFALAICGDPELVFLDEPTTGLDVEARTSLWATVRSLADRGCAVLLTTHYLEEAEALADRVAVLVRGHIVAQGTVDEIRGLCSARRIRCISGISPGLVRDWPGVQVATRENDWLSIEASSSDSVVRRLLREDPDLRELEVRPAGLAEAFAQITQEVA